MMPSLNNLPNPIKWMALFGNWILLGAVTFWQFQRMSVNEDSLPYFIVRILFLTWTIINIIFITLVYKNAPSWLKWRDIFTRPKNKDRLLIVASSFLILRICLWLFQGLLVRPLTEQVGGYIKLLTPALDLMGYVSLEIAVFIFFLNLHANLEYKEPFKKFILTAVVVSIILGLIVAVISITGLGILPGYKGDWQRGLPAVALLEWQILLACFFCLSTFFIESKKNILETPRLDIWICVAIWLGASILWLSQPVIPNASALKPREPNFEVYPFNDAQTYDELAQSVLVGNGFGDDRIPQRPLYVVFLIFSHVLVGQNYDKIIIFQTLVFAIFPVLLYLFGREIFSRPIGISVALLAVLRDYTSNFVSPFTGNLSYSKLYLSEIPTAILLILFLLIGIRWIKAGFPIFSGFLLGGVLGSAMLIRTQVIAALPVIVLFAFLVHPKKIKPLIKNIFLMLVTVAFVAAPWLWRNWHLTGELIFDNPESQVANLALRYGRLNGTEPEILPLPGESNAEYNTRLNQIAKDAIASNPSRAAWGAANSFLNHAVNNILLFPLRNDIRNINELWIPANAFWEGWEGTPNFSQSILLAFYIFLFGLGVTIAWIRSRWLGLLPLALNLAYNLWTSLALLSGQRFMLTMDWSISLYYMIGLFTLFGGFLFALDGGRLMITEWLKKNSVAAAAPMPASGWQKYIMFGILFFGIGLSLPLSEKVFLDKYPHLSQKEMAAELLASSSLNQPALDAACLQRMMDSDLLSFAQGRALYPRYYAAGEGEEFTDSDGYKVVNEGRLVFYLVGQANKRVIFKTSQQPDFFPNTSDVTLISSENGELWFVYVKQAGREKFYVSESFNATLCQAK